MNHSGDAADQVVNMTVRGVEVAANIAGKAALSLAAFLIAASKSQKRTRGRTRMRAFNGKPTKVFVIRSEDMKVFAEEARKYGVLYAAVINRKQPDGLVDVVVNANDAAKVNRIAERFALSTVEVDKIREDILEKRKAQENAPAEERETPPQDTHTIDNDTLDEMLEGSPKEQGQKQPEEVSQENPTMAGAEKQRTENSSPSAPISGNKDNTAAADIERKPSVRSQIKELREERKAKVQAEKQPQKAILRQTAHRQPKRKRKSKGKAR